MKQKKIWIILPILIVLAVGIFFLYRHFSPVAQLGEKQISISVDFGDGAVKDFDFRTDAAYLKEALESVIEIEGESTSQYGYTLYAVDGLVADFSSGNAYWAIYVNDQYGTYSLDKQPLADGEHYTIKYETY